MSTESSHKGLLPAGLHDVLPPQAAQEAESVAALMAAFAACGYAPVKPPLVEFESTLMGAAGNGGGSLSGQMFRLMDPVSQQMMALRADITLQVARIAESRLATAARPLRLSYAGEVLRVRGSQLRPERQFTQAGVELIGSDAVSADVEIIVLAGEALASAGVASPTIDINSPALVANLLADLDLDPETVAQLRAALDHKDAAAVREITRRRGVSFGASARLLDEMIGAAGPAQEVLASLRELALPSNAVAEVERLAEIVAGVRLAAPDMPLTLDPVEYRGFEYQTGASFTIFAAGVRGELGRGGRYITTGGEPATGFSLFLDSIMRAVPASPLAQTLYVPFAVAAQEGARLRREGWRTVLGLSPETDVLGEAARLGCSHAWIDGAAQPAPSQRGKS